MKKILTAVKNAELSERCKEIDKNIIVLKNVETDEELVEVMIEQNDVDILFLSSQIIEKYKASTFIEFLQKLNNKVKIYFFKEKNFEEIIEENENLKIFKNNEIDNELIKSILKEEKHENLEAQTAKIISITGPSGIGKSTFSTFLAKNVENSESKILLLNFDLDENTIKTLLKIKKYPEFSTNIEDMIININKNVDVLFNLNLLFSNKSQIDIFKIQEIINKLKMQYDLIIIDTSSNLENDYTRRVLCSSDTIFMLLEPNILGIKKAKNMLEVFENDWKILSSKIKIIINKTNMYQISDSILEEIFGDIQVVGKMKYHDSYNLMINKNVNKKELKHEYQKIYKIICKI